MFFDGVTYASISRNLAEGQGTFWNLYYTSAIYPEFHEHPPLAIGLQSLFFYVFGDQFFIEKVYSFLCFCLMLLAISKMWRLFSSCSTIWIPLFLILTVPTIIWCFTNNLLENTLTVFTTFSVFFYVNGLKKDNKLHTVIGSLFCFLAFLSKGPVGLFPLATIFTYWLVIERNSKVAKHLLIQFSTAIALPLILFSASSGAYESILEYLDHQVLAALKNEREINTPFRLKIILDLLIIMAIPIILLMITLTKKLQSNLKLRKVAYFFLLMGLSASLPLILSLKQSKFYLVPSIPFYCLGMGMLIQPLIMPFFDRLEKYKAIKLVLLTAIFLSLVAMIYRYGMISRDYETIECVSNYDQLTMEYTTVDAPESDCYNWTLVAYMMRKNRVSITCDQKALRLCE